MMNKLIFSEWMKSETLGDQIGKWRECFKEKGEVNAMFSFNCQLDPAYTQMEECQWGTLGIGIVYGHTCEKFFFS